MFLVLRVVFLSTMAIATTGHAKLFKPRTVDQTVHKKFSLRPQGTLIIENIEGSINIKTEWNQNAIALSAVVHAANNDELREIAISDYSNGEVLTLRTNYDQKEIKAAVDYNLVIPSNITVKLKTGDGNVTVNQVQGAISVATRNGSIEIFSPKGPVDATAKKTGSIVIHQPGDNVQATTAKGNITIYDAHKSVIATADNGSIELHSKKVPSTSKLALKTKTGSIQLFLPHETNAEIRARTVKGTLLCDHMMTVKSFTTQLNSNAWKRLQKEIDGTLGTGEAQIALQSQKGSIKIRELKA